MAEMAVAIIVVSLPSMRSFLRSGSFFSSIKSTKKSYGYGYGSEHRPGAEQDFARLGARGKCSARVHVEDDEGSEVELNVLNGNGEGILKTRRVSVGFEERAWV